MKASAGKLGGSEPGWRGAGRRDVRANQLLLRVRAGMDKSALERLPYELLVDIASHVDIGSLLSLAQA